ncbi:MAG: polysaccharide biosynthesis C-terminal domain-containing protein [Chitinivibrionales bacterium]|nr:polysaccharide biosynthesis C-terminal domain-containing protein [Chitinivibrionales bacterium]
MIVTMAHTKPVLNFLSLGAMRLVSAALAFALFLTVARHWGGMRLGEFSLLLSYFIFLQTMPLLGLSILLMRDLSQQSVLEAAYRSAAHAIALGAAVIIACGLSVTVYFLYPPHLTLPFVCIGCAIVCGAPAVADEAIIMAREKMWITASIAAGETALRTSACLIGVFSGHGLVWITLCFLLGRAAASIAYETILHKSRAPLDGALVKSLLRQCPTFLGVVFAGAALLRLDTIALSLTKNMAAVGTYNTAFRLFELFLSAVVIGVIALFPTVARKFDLSIAMRDRFIQFFKITMLVGIPATTCLMTISPWLTHLAYGGKFPQSAPVFSILTVMLFFYTVDRIFSTLEHSAKKPELDRNALLIGTAIFCGLLAGLVPAAGLTGAAIATAGAQGSIIIVRLFQVRTHLGWQGFLWHSRFIFLAALCMAATYFALTLFTNTLAAFAASMAAYGIVLWACGEFKLGTLSYYVSFVKQARAI